MQGRHAAARHRQRCAAAAGMRQVWERSCLGQLGPLLPTLEPIHRSQRQRHQSPNRMQFAAKQDAPNVHNRTKTIPAVAAHVLPACRLAPWHRPHNTRQIKTASHLSATSTLTMRTCAGNSRSPTWLPSPCSLQLLCHLADLSQRGLQPGTAEQQVGVGPSAAATNTRPYGWQQIGCPPAMLHAGNFRVPEAPSVAWRCMPA